MAERIPEPDVKGYTEEQIRRIRARYEAMGKKLPYPDPVDEPPLRMGPGPGRCWWATVWAVLRRDVPDIARHFFLGGATAGLSILLTTKDLTLAGAGFILGGIAGAVRKGTDDTLRAGGKTDMLTGAIGIITGRKPLQGGDGMIREKVYELSAEFEGIGTLLLDDVPNREQLGEFMAAIYNTVTKGADFAHVPKEERAKAIAHAFSRAGAALYDKTVTYSDETVAE